MAKEKWKQRSRAAGRLLRTWFAASTITLGLAAVCSPSGDAGNTAAIAALCSAILFSLVLLSRLRMDFVSCATLFSIFFAGASAWYWLVSAHPLDTSQLLIAGSLAFAFALAAIIGLLAAAAHLWFMVTRK